MKVLLLGLVLWVIAPQAHGQAVLQKILKNGELKIGMTALQPPFTMKDKENQLIGYEVDLARLIADAMEVKLTIVELPFGDLLPALKEGRIDAIMSGMTITPLRNLDVAFAPPYYFSGKSILTKSEEIAQTTNEDQINKASLRFVTLKGTTSQKYVEKDIAFAQLTTVDDYDDAISMLIRGEIDGLVADEPVVVLSRLRWPDEGFKYLERPLTKEPIGMAIPANDMLFHNLLKNYLKSIKSSGKLAELEKKWFVDAAWTADVESITDTF